MAALVLLILLGMIGWLMYKAWTIYQTRFAERQALEDARALDFINEAKSTRPSVVAPVAAVRIDVPRTTLLDAAGRVAYFMLKVELPDHEILARVDPASLFGANTLQPVRAMLDLVVCKRDFAPVAVVMLLRANDDPLREKVMQQLAQNGVRVLRWPVTALPERNTVRAQVLGESAATAQ
ncbi:MAG TPA: hypothetical protein VFW00_00440 [Rhodocyclaceae bacterium]|nr:hypothetical protein [Rhodocyclaceae bacterium]